MQELSVSPCVFPPLDPLRAQFGNALCRRPLPWPFVWFSQNCELDIAPAEDLFQAACALSLRVGNSLWKAELDSLDALDLHPAVADAGGAALYAELPEPLRLALLESLFAPLLDQAAAWLGTPVGFEDSTPKTDSDSVQGAETAWPGFVTLALRIPADRGTESTRERVLSVRLHYADATAAHAVIARLEALPQRRTDMPELPLECAVEAGSMLLPLGQLRGLEPGDVLLPDVWSPEAPRLRLPDGTLFACRAENGKAEVLGRLDESIQNGMMEETLTTDNNPDAISGVAPHATHDVAHDAGPHTGQNVSDTATFAESGAGVDVDSLPVELRFELDRLTVRVGELTSLGPGFVFALSCSTSDDALSPVTVRAAGRPVAKGRLVDINGTLGVQVTRMLAAVPDAGGVSGSES